MSGGNMDQLLNKDLAGLKPFRPPQSPRVAPPLRSTYGQVTPISVKVATRCNDSRSLPSPGHRLTSPNRSIRAHSPSNRSVSPGSVPTNSRLQSPIVPIPRAFAKNVKPPQPSDKKDSGIPRRATEVDIMRRELDEVRGLNDALRRRTSEDAQLITELTNDKEELKEEINMGNRKIAGLERDYTNRTADWEREKRNVETVRLREAALKTEVEMMQNKISALHDEIRLNHETAERRIAAITEAANHRMCEYDACIATLQGNINELQEKIHDQKEEMMQLQKLKDREIAAMDQIIKDGEFERAQLRYSMLDMRGTVRVCCRVRPLIPHDREYRLMANGKQTIRSLAAQRAATTIPGMEYIQFPDRADHRRITVSLPTATSVDGEKELKEYQFQFDRVFEPTDSQDIVFEEIQQLVQSALDGYKVCIFAYGQTGSGKTYTMEGPGMQAVEKDRSLQGMIPRAVEQIFDFSQRMAERGWDYTLTASFVEIYNEQIRDLLNDDAAYHDGPESFTEGKCKHEIRILDGYTILTGVMEVPVTDADTVNALLKLAMKNRKSSTTAMNDRASRSHSVFSLKIVGTHEGTAQQCFGVLNLIDLAGSERVALSGAQGERLRETTYINKSLTSLGDVIVSLAKGDAHVPYRNSKLTHMLQPYMGNESKTLMFVNVSPSELFLAESLNSLRFAAKVNACEIGLAKKRISSKK